MGVHQRIIEESIRFNDSDSKEFEVEVVQTSYRIEIAKCLDCESTLPIRSNGSKNPDSFFSTIDKKSGKRFNLMVENKGFRTSNLDLNIPYDSGCVILQTLYYTKDIIDKNLLHLSPSGIIIGDERLCRSLIVNDLYLEYTRRKDIDWSVPPSEALLCHRNKNALNDIKNDVSSGRLILGNARSVDENFDIKDSIDEIFLGISGLPTVQILVTKQNFFCFIQDILTHVFYYKFDEKRTIEILKEILSTGASDDPSVNQDSLYKITLRWSWNPKIVNNLNQFTSNIRTFQLLDSGSDIHFAKNPSICGTVLFDKAIMWNNEIYGRKGGSTIYKMMSDWMKKSGLDVNRYSYLRRCPAEGILYNGRILKDYSENILNMKRIFQSLIVDKHENNV